MEWTDTDGYILCTREGYFRFFNSCFIGFYCGLRAAVQRLTVGLLPLCTAGVLLDELHEHP
jgi:hypothetical protein